MLYYFSNPFWLLKMTSNCSFCDYTTTRSFNLKRHIETRHKDQLQKSDSKLQKNDSKLQKNDSKLQKNDSKLDHGNKVFPTCNLCGKEFTRNSSMKVHMETCDGTRVGTCKLCKVPFGNRSALYRHSKVCNGVALLPQNGDGKVINNVTININGNINTVNNNNTMNVLTFPDDNQDFDFVLDNITKAIMKHCVSAFSPEVGFNRFMEAVLENPTNRYVLKSNPNVSYSKIHVGNGKWKLATDTDVYPTMTHHMTTAAKAKLIEFKRDIRFMCEKFAAYVDSINTDDETEDYRNTLQRLKLLVVNMTREIEEAEQQVC